VAVTPSRTAPVRWTPTTSGVREIDGLAEHARLRFDPADTPSDDAEAIDHRRVRIGADEGVGIIDAILSRTPLARYSRLTWWTMPMPGGTTPKS